MGIDCTKLESGESCICFIEYMNRGEQECVFIGRHPFPKDEYGEYVFTYKDGHIFTVNERGFMKPFNTLDYYAHNPLVLRKKPKKEKFTGWINIYANRNSGCWYEDLEKANYAADGSRIACIRVEKDYEPGEGIPQSKQVASARN